MTGLLIHSGILSVVQSSIHPVLPLAASPEGVIWVIIIMLWGIAQMVNQGRRTRARRDLAPGEDRSRPPINDNVREILEQLTGTKLEMPQAPPPPQPRMETVPAPGEQHVHPAYRRKVALAPKRPAYVTPPAAPQQAPARQEAPQPVMTATYSQLNEQGMVFPNMVMSIKAMDLPSMRQSLSMPSFGRDAGAIDLPDFQDRDELRRAILCGVIFGPPRALVQEDVMRIG